MKLHCNSKLIEDSCLSEFVLNTNFVRQASSMGLPMGLLNANWPIGYTFSKQFIKAYIISNLPIID